VMDGLKVFTRNEKPCGPSWCRNRMAATVPSDYLWFLDSDTVALYPETLEDMLSALDRDPSVCAVGGTVENIHGTMEFLQKFPPFNQMDAAHLAYLVENCQLRFYSEGETIKVKVLEVSRDGKIRLSRKALLEDKND